MDLGKHKGGIYGIGSQEENEYSLVERKMVRMEMRVVTSGHSLLSDKSVLDLKEQGHDCLSIISVAINRYADQKP